MDLDRFYLAREWLTSSPASRGGSCALSGRVLSGLSRSRLCLRRLEAGFPGVVTPRMEVQGDPLLIEVRFDLVLDVAFGNDDATKVAGRPATFTTPHSHGSGTA